MRRMAIAGRNGGGDWPQMQITGASQGNSDFSIGIIPESM